eukprot:5684046-Prymnesium_polylepis.1
MIVDGMVNFAPAEWEITHHTVDGNRTPSNAQRLIVTGRNIMPQGTSGSGLCVVAFDMQSNSDVVSIVAVASFANREYGVWRPVDQLPSAQEHAA